MDKVTTIILSNRGDDYVPAALESLEKLDLNSPDYNFPELQHSLYSNEFLILDDSGEHEKWSGSRIPIIAGEKAGYNTAMKRVREEFLKTDGEFLLFWEEDFTLEKPVRLEDMVDVLFEQRIAQVTLLRQPWFANEVAAGGMVEAILEGNHFEPNQTWISQVPYTSHHAFWTCNPNIQSREFVENHPWPDGDWSESRFGKAVFNEGWESAFLGYIGDEPLVKHHGIRTGTGY